MTLVVFLCFVLSTTWADTNMENGIATDTGFDCGNGIVISLNDRCDGKNDCGNWDDECDCEGIYDSLCRAQPCLSEKKTIRRRQLCDGSFDCKDLFDECLCDKKTEENEDTLEICNRMFQDGASGCNAGELLCESSTGTKHCINVSQICDDVQDCACGIDEKFCVGNYMSFRNHSSRRLLFSHDCTTSCACDGIPQSPDFSYEMNCRRFFYCPKSDGVFPYLNKTSPTLFGDFPGLYIDWRRTFDGVQDCAPAEDEWHPKFFYCFSNWNSTDQERGKAVRNTELDINQLKGLANNCNHHPEKVMSSPSYFSNSIWFKTFRWIISVTALITNSIVTVNIVFIRTGKKVRTEVPWTKRANEIFVLNLAISELLISISLVFFGIMDAISMGEYWKYEMEWKSSIMCQFVGFYMLTVVAVGQISLFCLTGLRLFTTLYPYKRVAKKWLWLAAISAWIIPLAFAIVFRIIEGESVEAVTIPNLPQVDATVLERDQVEELMRRILVLHRNYNQSHRSVSPKLFEDMSWSEMESVLTDINPKFGNWKLIKSVYSDTPFCQPRLIVEVGQPGWELTFAAIILGVALYVFIAITYIIILRKTTSADCCFCHKQCRKNLDKISDFSQSTEGPGTFVQRQSSRAKEDRNLQRRICWMIWINCVTWVPVTVLNAISLIDSSIGVRTTFTESFATLTVELSSAINPFFYSKTVRKIGHYSVIRPIKRICGGCKA